MTLLHKKGDKGQEVRRVQKTIGGLKVDGDFGPKTEDAVKDFQKENGLSADGIVGPKTYEALMQEDHKYTLDQIKEAVISKGYEWFEEGDFNVNIVGVRNMAAGTRVTNKFDDHITVSYKDLPLAPNKCPYLKIKLIVGDRTPTNNSPSLDRIDNSKGYVKSNVQIISRKANQIKNNATFEEFEMIYLHWKKQKEERK